MSTRPDEPALTESSELTRTSSDASPPAPATSGRSVLQALGGLGYKPQRVRLRSLVLDNFKSFARKVQIDLLDGFTAIAGPNGSGKSNLIDALLFVLGFASSKGLRADRLTDLINNESGKPSARVSLELEVVTDKGETKKLEVSRVVRRVRQSESQAHYEVDGSAVRMHDLREILQDLGLPPSGLNIVLQNDVTRILGMGEVARRQILDEIAGAAEFDLRIGAAHKELAEADRHENETKVVLGEIETRLQSLEKEKEQALAYQALVADKDRLDSELLVLDAIEAQHRAHKKREEVASRKDRVETFRNELAEAESAQKTAEAELAAVEAEISAKGEGERLEALKQVEALKTNIANVRSRANEARSEGQAIRGKDKERDKTLAEANAHEATLASAEDGVKRDLDALLERQAALRRDLAIASSEAEKRAKGTLDAFEAQKILARDAESQRAREAEIAGVLRTLGEQDARHETERAMIAQTLAADRARRKELELSSAEAVSSRRLAREDQAREEQRLRNLVVRSQQLRAGLEKADHDVAQARDESARLDERRRALLDGSGGRGLVAIRHEKLAGLHGPLHELLKFDAEHALAIEKAAGSRLFTVVVDDEQTAKRAIEILKRTESGELRFAPLNRINVPQLDLRPVKKKGVLGYALDFVRFDPIYERVVRLALTDTLLVETVQVAIDLGIGTRRMVTLDGDLMEKSGIMQGGSRSRSGTAFAGAARLEQEIEKKQAALVELEKRRSAARAELEAIDTEGRAAQAALASRAAKHDEAVAAFERLNEELTRLEAKVGPEEARLAKLEAEIARVRGEIARAEAEIAKIKEALGSMDARLRGVPDPAHDDYDELTKRAQAMEESLRELDAPVAEAHERFSQAQVDRRGAIAEVEAAQRKIAEAKEAAAAADARGVALDAEAEQLEAELKTKERAVRELLEELRELAEQRDEAKVKAQDTRDAAKECERALEQEKEKLAAAELALVELDAAASDLRAKAGERKLALEGPAGSPLGRCQDPTTTGEACTLDPGELGKLREAGKRDLARTEGKMKDLGAVNMLAIEQHAEYAARKAEVEEKIATLDREMAAIRSKIVELEGAKKTAFLEAFEAVAASFKEDFTELMGGEGWLELANPESPFEGGLTIVARPRGKAKASRLDALSGGEKALTALAFIFSLQKANPAPFYVFDEVDAGLDGVNAVRLADAIRRRGAERQYFAVSHKRAVVEKAHRAIGVTSRKGIGTQVAGITLDEVSAVEAAVEAEKRAAAARRASVGEAAAPGELAGRAVSRN